MLMRIGVLVLISIVVLFCLLLLSVEWFAFLLWIRFEGEGYFRCRPVEVGTKCFIFSEWDGELCHEFIDFLFHFKHEIRHKDVDGSEKQTVVIRAFEFICKSCRGVVRLDGMISECLVDSREIASAWVRGEIIGLRRESAGSSKNVAKLREHVVTDEAWSGEEETVLTSVTMLCVSGEYIINDERILNDCGKEGVNDGLGLVGLRGVTCRDDFSF